jgi:hypothetical protein
MATRNESVEEGSQGMWPFKPWQVVQSSGRSSTGELLTNYCYIFTIISIVTFIICFSLQEKYKKEVVKNTVKTSTTRRSPLTVGPSMTTEAEKHMDGEIDVLFSLTLWMRDTIPLTTVDYFFEGLLCSMGCWTPGRQCCRSKVHRPRLIVLRLVYLRYT